MSRNAWVRVSKPLSPNLNRQTTEWCLCVKIISSNQLGERNFDAVASFFSLTYSVIVRKVRAYTNFVSIQDLIQYTNNVTTYAIQVCFNTHFRLGLSIDWIHIRLEFVLIVSKPRQSTGISLAIDSTPRTHVNTTLQDRICDLATICTTDGEFPSSQWWPKTTKRCMSL